MKNNNPKTHTEQIEEKQLDKTRHYTTLLERSKRDDTQQDKTLQDRPKKQGKRAKSKRKEMKD